MIGTFKDEHSQFSSNSQKVIDKLNGNNVPWKSYDIEIFNSERTRILVIKSDNDEYNPANHLRIKVVDVEGKDSPLVEFHPPLEARESLKLYKKTFFSLFDLHDFNYIKNYAWTIKFSRVDSPDEYEVFGIKLSYSSYPVGLFILALVFVSIRLFTLSVFLSARVSARKITDDYERSTYVKYLRSIDHRFTFNYLKLTVNIKKALWVFFVASLFIKYGLYIIDFSIYLLDLDYVMPYPNTQGSPFYILFIILTIEVILIFSKKKYLKKAYKYHISLS